MPVIKIDDQEFEISEGLKAEFLSRVMQMKEGQIPEQEFFAGSSRKREYPGTSSYDQPVGEELCYKWQKTKEEFSPSANLLDVSGHSYPGRESGFSSTSGIPTVASSTSSAILLKYEIDGENINIIVNSQQRPGTAISGSQGDHVTAYAVLLQTICSIIGGEDIHQAPQVLYDATKCFVGDISEIRFKGANDELLTFEAKIQEVIKQFFPREIRKQLTSHLREMQKLPNSESVTSNPALRKAIDFLSARKDNPTDVSASGSDYILDVNLLKDCVKRGNQAIFAQLVVALGEEVLRKYNATSTAAFPKLKEQGKDLGEGNRVKMAMRNLRIFNKVLLLKQQLVGADLVRTKELIEIFQEDCKEIIRAARPQTTNIDTFNKNFNAILKELFGWQEKSIDLDNVKEQQIEAISLKHIDINKMGELFNDLFDFKQSRILEASGNEQDGEIVNRGGVEKVALIDPSSCLYEVVARHVDFMLTAFNGIAKLDKELQQEIFKSFYGKVMAKSISDDDNNQGWEDFEYFDDQLGTLKKLDISTLHQGVDTYRSEKSKTDLQKQVHGKLQSR